MATKNLLNPIPLTSIDSSTFTGSYQVINTTGLSQPVVILRIINACDKNVTVSYDGTNDHDYVRAGSELQLPSQSNALPQTAIAQFPKGLKIYVKGSAGTGLVSVAGYYQPAS